MSAPVALLAYAESKNVGIQFIDGKVRLSGTKERVAQVADSFKLHREALLHWLEREPGLDQPSALAERQSARKYYEHHFGCVTCISAGKLRGLKCFAGLELWGIYLNLANTKHPEAGNGSTQCQTDNRTQKTQKPNTAMSFTHTSESKPTWLNSN